MTAPSADDRRARSLLIAGALLGVALAGFGLARSGAPATDPPEGAIALVNGVPLPRESFDRFVTAVAAERGEAALPPEERERLLERMLDEELLLQRALALGLARHEPTARRAIVQALVASVAGEAEEREPRDAELRAFYEAEPERFLRPGALTLDVAFVSQRDRSEREARERAAEIARRLRAGEPFDDVVRALGDVAMVPYPGGPLPPSTLRRYLGPTAADAALGLEPGDVSAPLRGSDGFRVLVLRGRSDGAAAPYAEIREQVRAEYLRTRGEQALTDYLAELRAEATISRAAIE